MILKLLFLTTALLYYVTTLFKKVNIKGGRKMTVQKLLNLRYYVLFDKQRNTLE